MDNKTQINPNIHNATVVNPQIGQATAINPSLTSDSAGIANGTILGDKYKIIEPLNATTGEADLYLCEADSVKYVAKLYRRQKAIKPETIRVLKSINSPYVARLYDTGTYKGKPYEIIPYYKNGSLQGKTFTLDGLKKTVIPCINEALKCLHEKGLFHKDLKPSNIMLRDYQKGVAIIDFGISSVVDKDNTVIVTQTGMTPTYSAPETFRGTYLIESDYYAFGITLFELYYGYTPYQNMSAEEIARFTALQNVPLPQDIPEELKDLIIGLTYYDLTHRTEKKNPNRRWTYQEVDNWLKGKKQVIPGEGTGVNVENSIPAYTFLGQKYKDLPSLVTALASNWKDGKKQLYRGLLSGFFKSFNPEIAGFCMDAEEEATKNPGSDDIVFWDLLYRIYPELSGFYWFGHTYESLPALGREMLEKMWAKDRSDYDYWNSILKNQLLSKYLVKVKSNNDKLAKATAALESSYKINIGNRRALLMDYYTMAYLLSGQKLFAVGGKKLKSVPELAAYMKSLLDSSYEEFEAFCHSMIDYNDTLDVQLEAWLIALGKRSQLEVWRSNLSE